MLDIIKKIKYWLIFFLVNIFFLDEIFALLFMICVLGNEKLMAIKTLIALPYCIFVIANKFYLLPLICYISIKYIKQEEIVDFFIKWKSSFKIQILYLIIAFVSMPILYTILSLDDLGKYSIYELFKTYFVLNIQMGLYQAYLILYFYWFIEYIFKSNKYLKSLKQNKILPLLQDIFILIQCLKLKSIIDFIKKHWLFAIIVAISITIVMLI